MGAGLGYSAEDVGLARVWVRAAWGEVLRAVEGVHDFVRAEVEARGPVCAASGRCCKFERYGHRLYVTGLEAACTVARLGGTEWGGGARELERVDVSLAVMRGDCPFLVGGLCGVHSVRPVGCRLYYCDPTAQEWQKELAERCQGMIRRVHEEHGVPYLYAEWRWLLGLLVEAMEKGEGGEEVAGSRIGG